MNWDRIKGNWKQFKGRARRQWGRLTEDDLEVVAGKVNQKQLAEWLARRHKIDPIHK